MSVSSGYVHISVRNAQNRALAAQRHASQAAGYSEPGYRNVRNFPRSVEEPMPSAVIAGNGQPGPQAVGETAARGFVLYVGLNEAGAAENGTTLAEIATQVRSYLMSIAPNAQTHAAVALAPSNAQGAHLDVVRQALGDPTINRRPRIVENLVRNQNNFKHSTGVLIDLSRREVHLDGDTLNLTFKEFELLNYLVENGQRTVGREELLENLWKNAEEVPNERTIDVHIRRLRSKLGRLANTVRTVRGQGYRFYEHPEVVVWAAPEYAI
ncbi:winged helix-turn-helix domain-containing protein [Neomicrococcus lactis]